MSNDISTPEGKDPVLWSIARRRAGFRRHLTTYLIINGFLWAIWYVTTGRYEDNSQVTPWPIWSTLGWGIGLAFHYSNAFIFPNSTATEREYDQLKKNQL